MISKKAMKEAIKQFDLWTQGNEELAKLGLHGTDYYVAKVEELEAKVKKLEQKLKRRKADG